MKVNSQFSEPDFGELLRTAETLVPDFELVVTKLHFVEDEDGRSLAELKHEVMSIILETVLWAHEIKPNVLRATLKEIARNPSLHEHAPDQVLDLLAYDYHRGDGDTKSHCFDLYGEAPANHPSVAIAPDPGDVARAATQATNRVPSIPGRPPKIYQDRATARIVEVYGRYRGTVKRKFVLTSVNGNLTQRDEGDFHQLLEVVFAPFNNHFPSLELGFDTMVDKAIEMQKIKG